MFGRKVHQALSGGDRSASTSVTRKPTRGLCAALFGHEVDQHLQQRFERGPRRGVRPSGGCLERHGLRVRLGQQLEVSVEHAVEDDEALVGRELELEVVCVAVEPKRRVIDDVK